MEATAAIIAGAVCGLAGCLPMAVLFERALKGKKDAKPSIPQGLVSVLCSFVMLSLALLVAFLASAETAPTFGCAMMATFLLVWAAESLRALKDARRADRAEGKEE